MSNSVPGEEAFEKGVYIKLWVRHDACVEEKVVQPIVSAEGNQIHTFNSV